MGILKSKDNFGKIIIIKTMLLAGAIEHILIILKVSFLSIHKSDLELTLLISNDVIPKRKYLTSK